jgi:hypothetical protein
MEEKMSLKEVIKELKGEIAEQDKEDAKPEDEGDGAPAKEADTKPAESKEEPKKDDAKPDEKPAEEVKAEPKEEKPDDLAFQRLRRENAAAKKRAETAEAEAAEAKAALAARAKPDADESAAEPPALDREIEEIKHDRRMKNAEREFMDLESKFAASTPDYHDVSKEYAIALAQSIKIQNPRMSNQDVGEETKKALLMKASQWVNKGFDPIEELYNEAKELGFKGESFKKKPEAAKEEPEKEIKPDMARLAANRKKSTGMTGSSGESKGQITKQAAADFTVAEWARLPKDEKRRLMYE